MYYSLIGLLALAILLITNHDVLFHKGENSDTPVQKTYRWFLIAVILYYLSDILWGILETWNLTTLLYADTVIYFIAMALGILFWTRYVSAYLEGNNPFSRFLKKAGTVFFGGVTSLTILNLFVPIMFWFDEEGRYHTGPARNIALYVQIIILLLTAVYALHMSSVTFGASKQRHLTIGLFGLIMQLFISIQVFEPYLPLYAIGYMLGCCLLRTFVIENEREEYRINLETALERERNHFTELNSARALAYKDALTGVQSRLAYFEKQDTLDKAIAAGTLEQMAVAVFDINILKKINDEQGHEAGDNAIKEAAHMICEVFSHAPVYRIGGDEFAAILEGYSFERRNELMEDFNRQNEEHIQNHEVVVSAGMSDYIPNEDTSFAEVFERADLKMYWKKQELESRENDS